MKMDKFNVEYESFKGKKEENEDYLIVDPEARVLVMADGMTGFNGRYASSEAAGFALRELRHLNQHTPPDGRGYDFTHYMKEVFDLANHRIVRHADMKNLKPIPGTTLDAVVFKDDGIFYAHVGDSSIYALVNDQLIKHTKDQNVRMEDHRELPDINPSAPGNFIGKKDFDINTVQTGTIGKFDKLVMMTDGLTDICTESELKYLLLNFSGEKLIKQAAEIYAHPSRIYESYLKENPRAIIKLVTEHSDVKFKELQKELMRLDGDDDKLEKIKQYFTAFPGFEKAILDRAKQVRDFGEYDNFSIIVIEPRKKFMGR